MYRWQGRFFEVDPDNPSAEGICDFCGFRFNLKDMQWNYQYQGSTMLQNTRFLICGRPSCLDAPNPQDMPFILPPDPMPIFNARPEPYTLDEGSWLITQDAEILTTQGGDYLGTQVPLQTNSDTTLTPGQVAATCRLQSTISYPSGSLSGLYLDLFDGNPATTGFSVLATITGSATRTDIASDMSWYQLAGINVNPDVISLTTSSAATCNVNYAALYSAASSGSLLGYGRLSVNGPSVTLGNPVQFNPLGLRISF